MRRHVEPIVISAFTEEQVTRLTGVSLRQLRYWARDQFFAPSLQPDADAGRSLRLYSFRDLVCLKILGHLRNEIGVSLGHLRDVKNRLSHLGEDMWTKTTLYVLNKRVIFENPETGKKEDIVNGQKILEIPLKIVSSDMKKAVLSIRKRQTNTIGRIDIHQIGRRNPVIAGTRIPVQTIKEFHEAGYTSDEIIAQYPTLTKCDIEVAIKCEVAA
jgi:DNA-binding transcriptional MerR regulator